MGASDDRLFPLSELPERYPSLAKAPAGAFSLRYPGRHGVMLRCVKPSLAWLTRPSWVERFIDDLADAQAATPTRVYRRKSDAGAVGK